MPAEDATPTPRRVFISYSHQDGLESAKNLAQFLRQNTTHEVWLDLEAIPGGASWTKTLETALTNCDTLLAILTPGAHASDNCHNEHIRAMNAGKQVIPILIRTTETAAIPLHLETKQWRKFPQNNNKS